MRDYVDNQFLLASSWNHILGAFQNQALRLAIELGIQPSYAREIVGKIHGFSGWQGLSSTVAVLHDIALAVHYEMTDTTKESAYRKSNVGYLRLLSTFKYPSQLGLLEKKLKQKHPTATEHDEEAYNGWEVYQQIKEEFSYRTLWREGILVHTLSWATRGIANEMADNLDQVSKEDSIILPDGGTLSVIMKMFHGASHELHQIQEKRFPVKSYDELSNKPPLATSLGIEDESTWMTVGKLVKELAYLEPGHMDGRTEDWPVLALLSHAPDDCRVKPVQSIMDDGTISIWSDVLFQRRSDIVYAGLLGSGAPARVSSVSIEEARYSIGEEYAGWTRVEWD